MIALALSGGAAWGLAHIGVLEVLERNNIPIDMIAGTSAGAIIGCLWAAGIKSADMISLLPDIKWSTFGKPVLPRRGLMNSKTIETFIDTHIGINRTFQDLNIPLLVTAADLYSGELIVLKEGRINKAVRASACVPMLFTPVKYQDRLLVDGGLLNNLPVDAALEAGAKEVIAVDFSPKKMADFDYDNQWEIGLRSLIMMQNEQTNANRKLASILIQPAIEAIHPADLKEGPHLVQSGREAAEAMLQPMMKLKKRREGRLPILSWFKGS